MTRLFANVLSAANRISIKLFLWFWLVAILSILATRFISAQLASEIKILPAHHEDVRRLHHIKHSIARRDISSVDQLLARQKKRANSTLWLKSTATNTVYSDAKQSHPLVSQFLNENELTDKITVRFKFARLSGPQLIQLAGQDYQLYLLVKDQRQHFGQYLLELPYWARILLPLSISFLLCLLIARTLTRPLRQLQLAAHRFGEGELSSRAAQASLRSDEVGQLAKSFNLMADKLSLNITAQQRLLGDVSHELRSPMTRLQLALALAQQQAADSNEQQRYFDRCELEVSRLDQMLAHIMAWSRMENSLIVPDKTPVILHQLINELIDDAQFVADEKQVTITFSEPPVCQLLADRSMLASAIANVLSNAVKYAPEKSEIKVSLTHQSHHCTITISDQGTGVPEESIAKIFEPFYRVAGDRDRQSGGTGLGLAIAKQAIVAHGGDIHAQNGCDGGLAIRIALPSE